MKITRPAKAGTLESNDIYIMVMPNEGNGVELHLDSIVMQQFGEEIERVILETVKEVGVEDVIIRAQDKGALNYTIKARVETAIKRGCE